jgi:exosortase
MTTCEITVPESPPAPAREADERRWRAAVALGLVGLAHLPWLAVQGRILWSYPHYQFAPLVPLGAAALAVRDSRRLGPLVPGTQRWSVGLLAASWLLMALAAVLYSPLFGTLAALTTLLALAQSWGGARLVRAMLPAWAFLWVAVRPPLGLDLDLIYALQSVATWWSSPVLDLLGVFHVAAGHVIELADRRLLVEEACSGIYSLFVALTATLFYVLWVRRGWLTSLLLFAAATAWVMVGNVVRIVTTAVLWSRVGVDINSGWKHELFGLLILVLTVGLILSTDNLVQGVLGAARRVWSEQLAWRSRQAWNALRLRFAGKGARSGVGWTAPGLGGGGPGTRAAHGEATDPGEPTRWPATRRVWLASWPVLAVFGLIGAGQLAVAARGALYAAPALERSLASLKADDLPERVGPYQREGFAVERNAAQGIRGEHSRVWSYRSPRATAVVSADYPFVGWHEVTDCYRGLGWVLGGRTVEPGGAGQAGPRVAATMVKPLERYGLLVFASDDERGEPLSPPSYRGWRAVLSERLSFGQMRLLGGQPSGQSRGGTVPSYQIQVLWDCEDPPTPADEAQARELFEQARAAFRRAVSGSATSGGQAPRGRTS